MKPLLIRSPYFSAGYRYNWIPRFSSAGVGIAESYVRENDPIEIETRGEKYNISRDEAVNLIKEYKSVEFKKGVKLGVIPLDAFKKNET